MAMFNNEIRDIAEEFVRDHLRFGIEFSTIHEHEDMSGEDDEDLRHVHDAANAMLRFILESIDDGELNLDCCDLED